MDGMTLETIIGTAIPICAGLVAWGVHVENRITRLEDKIDLIMDYFHLEPRKRR